MERHHLADATATRALGRMLAERLGPQASTTGSALLLLQGDLGAGKTCLVQGIAEGLGIREPITSPTFALAQHYAGQLGDGSRTALVHLDLYRLEQADAADELLAQEEEEASALGAVLAVEWPERLSRPPGGAWMVEIALADPATPEAGRIAEVHPSA
jgi:tRNA threonylcarbamoyladenosine biosynthesis protein TsaE